MKLTDEQRIIPLESEVYTRCYRCETGNFVLMHGSSYQWRCDKCGHHGNIRVVRNDGKRTAGL